jgi:hypothetical protein
MREASYFDKFQEEDDRLGGTLSHLESEYIDTFRSYRQNNPDVILATKN